VTEPEGERDVLALERGPVTGAVDLELAGEPVDHTGDHVLNERSCEPVERPAATLIIRSLDQQRAVVLANRDGLGD
jgi:hypothetical protein